MTTRTKLELIGGAVVLAVLGLLGHLWLRAHDRAIAADVKVAMLQQQRESIYKETQQKVADVQVERKSADTVEKQVGYVENHIKIPLSIQKPVNDIDPPLLTFPQSGMPVLADYVATHEVTLVELKGCQDQLRLCDQQVKALQAGRKSGFWGNVKNVTLGLGIGFAAGYVAHR